MKKKILIYRNSMKASGGVERVIANLAKEWKKDFDICLLVKDSGESFYALPHEMDIVSINTPFHYDMNNRLQRIFSTLRTFIKSRKRLKEAIEEISPDYIYSTTPLNALELFSLGKYIRAKMVVSEHGSYYGYNRIYTLIKRLIYPYVYCISVPNSMDTTIYQKWGCNAVFIPHIVTYKAEEKNNLDQKIVLNIGRLTQDKQQEILIKMWKKVKNRDEWQLWIVGDGEKKETLERLIVDLELEDSVKLIPATKDIIDIYKKASVFAFASKCEGFGMVLLEAMSFGIPCISFDCPSGPRDVIESGYNGYLVELNNLNGYIERLEQLIDMTKEERYNFGDNAFMTIRNWDNEEILKKWKKIYK